MIMSASKSKKRKRTQKGKNDNVTDTRDVRFTDAKGPTDEILSNNIIRRGVPEGRRFSSRFPARQTRAMNSLKILRRLHFLPNQTDSESVPTLKQR